MLSIPQTWKEISDTPASGKNIPMIVALNIWDDTKHKGITIDINKRAITGVF
jgi:hypothetical protein